MERSYFKTFQQNIDRAFIEKSITSHNLFSIRRLAVKVWAGKKFFFDFLLKRLNEYIDPIKEK